MASTFLVVFVGFLVVSSSFSLPILSEVEKVQSKKSENTPTVLSLDKEMELVPGSSTETVLEVFTQSFEADHVERVKRQVIIPGPKLCSSDRIEYGGKCLTKEQYDEYNEVSDDEAER